jgi:hypothetical protein
MAGKDFGQPEQGVCVGYATIKGKDMIEPNDPNYKWRPATKGDIGSIARFSDEYDDEYTYGILVEMYEVTGFTADGDEVEALMYSSNTRRSGFDKCEIQYDANKEP